MLQQSDQVDLNLCTFWQLCDAHGRPRRLVVAEVFSVNPVQHGEVREVGDVHRRLRDAVEAASRCREYGGQVLEDTARLRGEVTFDEIAGFGVERNLSRC